MSKRIDGFSKLSKAEKIDWITKTHFKDAQQAAQQLRSYWNSSPEVQTQHDEFIENTLTNFYLPLLFDKHCMHIIFHLIFWIDSYIDLYLSFSSSLKMLCQYSSRS